MAGNANHDNANKRESSTFTEEQLHGIYDLLRMMASRQMSRERQDHTLSPTDLVHEAWLRLSSSTSEWDSKNQFLSAAAVAMRRTLVDHARARSAGKRKREMKLDITLSSLQQESLGSEDLILLDDLIDQLEKADEVMSRVVVMRLFGGYSHIDIGDILGLSERTIIRKWQAARNWLTVTMTTNS